MSTVITVTYENGVLRPLRPINFKEHQAIHLQVLSEEPLSEREILIQKLIQAGAIAPPRGYSDIEPISEEERRQLADELARTADKPLSQIIIEERGEW
jgi:predicted DNA-binding antitoxin AbrB/MazE fold protein